MDVRRPRYSIPHLSRTTTGDPTREARKGLGLTGSGARPPPACGRPYQPNRGEREKKSQPHALWGKQASDRPVVVKQGGPRATSKERRITAATVLATPPKYTKEAYHANPPDGHKDTRQRLTKSPVKRGAHKQGRKAVVTRQHAPATTAELIVAQRGRGNATRHEPSVIPTNRKLRG